MEMSGQRPHLLALSYPLQGHINPLMQLCEALAASGDLLVTFVNSEANHSRILEANRKLGIPSHFRLVGLPVGSVSYDHGRSGCVKRMGLERERCMAPRLEQLVKELNETGSPVTCFISDLNEPWALAVARKLMIPLVAGFWLTIGASLSVAYNIPYLLSSGELHPNGYGTRKMIHLPGLPHLPTTCFPWLMGTNDEDNEFLFQNTKRAMEEAKELKWILCNTCSEWETKVTEALSQESPIFTVGPLFLSESLPQKAKETNRLSTALWSEDNKCLEWLDCQATSSVLYVAFGSVATLSRLQHHELALGLEASHQPFLWALRTNFMDGKDPVLPDGFVERTKDRACIVSWAPQSLVLAHRSIGWFLTHSGWNSVAESICQGVPMLAWGFLGDLRMIYEHIVNEWGVAMAFVADENGLVPREEVERLVRCAMCEGGEKAEAVRRQVGKLRDAGRAAVSGENGGGSSYINIQAFFREIMKHQRPGTSV